jgi:hypothetical protein
LLQCLQLHLLPAVRKNNQSQLKLLRPKLLLLPQLLLRPQTPPSPSKVLLPPLRLMPLNLPTFRLMQQRMQPKSRKSFQNKKAGLVAGFLF